MSSSKSLNKFKLVYLSTITGFVSNAILDVPLMILYSKIGIPPFLGAITASIIGYGLSILIALISLKKECKLKYRDTIKTTMKMLVPLVVMAVVVFILMNLVPVNLNSKISCIVYVAINAIIGAITYIVIAFKMGLVTKVLGKRMTNGIIKKLTFGKISI